MAADTAYITSLLRGKLETETKTRDSLKVCL